MNHILVTYTVHVTDLVILILSMRILGIQQIRLVLLRVYKIENHFYYDSQSISSETELVLISLIYLLNVGSHKRY